MPDKKRKYLGSYVTSEFFDEFKKIANDMGLNHTDAIRALASEFANGKIILEVPRYLAKDCLKVAQ